MTERAERLVAALGRQPHVIKYREWALNYSPTRLRHISLQKLEIFLSNLRRDISPHATTFWRAFVLGADSRLDSSQIKSWYEILSKDKSTARDLMILISIVQKVSENAGMTVVCDRAPFLVPMESIHVFDLSPSEIRTSLSRALADIESASIPNLMTHLVSSSTPLTDYDLPRFRPAFDAIVAALLRFSGGLAIDNAVVRFWIAANASRARFAVDQRERRLSRQSLESIMNAVLPPEEIRDAPNEAALSRGYFEIRRLADPILRMKYRNPAVRRLALKEKFPRDTGRVIEHLADCRQKEFALGLLSARRGGLNQGYLWNLIKRGNLFHRICAHWFEALAEVPLTELVPPSQN